MLTRNDRCNGVECNALERTISRRCHVSIVRVNGVVRIKSRLLDRESNPGLPRDRRRYSPLYYRGVRDLCHFSRILNLTKHNHSTTTNTPQRIHMHTYTLTLAHTCTNRHYVTSNPALHCTTHLSTSSLLQSIFHCHTNHLCTTTLHQSLTRQSLN